MYISAENILNSQEPPTHRPGMTPTRTSGTLHPRPALVVRICGSRYKNQKNTRRRTRGRKMKKFYGPLPYKLQKKRPSSPKEKQREKSYSNNNFFDDDDDSASFVLRQAKKKFEQKKVEISLPALTRRTFPTFFPFFPKKYLHLSLSHSLFPPFVTEETAPFLLPRLRGFPLSPPPKQIRFSCPERCIHKDLWGNSYLVRLISP